MAQQISQYFLTSANVNTFIFIIPLRQAIHHIRSFQPQEDYSSQGKTIRICYLVIIQGDFNQFMKVQQQFFKIREVQMYSACLTPFYKREEAIEHIKMMENMNGAQFQNQYIEMNNLLQQEIQTSLIKQYCQKEFGWSEPRINNLIQDEGINKINKFLNYRGFNQLQMVRINNMWGFIEKSMDLTE